MTMTFSAETKDETCLPKILMLCQRLGGKISYVSFAEKYATISLNAPEDKAHRFAPQIRRIIDVRTLVELKVNKEAMLA